MVGSGRRRRTRQLGPTPTLHCVPGLLHLPSPLASPSTLIPRSRTTPLLPRDLWLASQVRFRRLGFITSSGGHSSLLYITLSLLCMVFRQLYTDPRSPRGCHWLHRDPGLGVGLERPGRFVCGDPDRLVLLLFSSASEGQEGQEEEETEQRQPG